MSDEEAGPILEIVLAAQERHREYAQIKTLTAAAERLAEYALDTGASHLLAASPLAERVVGAAVVLAGGQLEGASVENGDGRHQVLVVDVAVAGPFAIQAAATQARAAGTQSVRRVALDPLPPANDWFTDADGIDLLPV